MHLLFWLSVIPSLLLAHSVLSYDKIEKEPLWLLVGLFMLGVLSCFPASLIEGIGDALIGHIAPEGSALYSALMFLVCVPLAEEGVKLLALRTTRKNRNFNYTFDGVVYGVMVGLGFATLENIIYVFDSMSVQLALMRGLLSVPLHCTCGVFMGYYYGVDQGLRMQGLDQRASAAHALTLLVPCLVHGLYDYSLDRESGAMTLVFLAVTLLAFALARRQVRYASAHDTPIITGIAEPGPGELPLRHRWRLR